MCAIMTRKMRVRIRAIPQMREIVPIFGESELCVYNSNSYPFVFVRFRSIVGADYPGNRREKKVTFTLCHSFRLQTCE